MKRKCFVSLFLAIMLLLATAMPVNARTDRNGNEDYDSDKLSRCCVGKILDKLNSGYFEITNVRRYFSRDGLHWEPYIIKCCDYYMACEHIPITSHLPWTDCTNIFGHNMREWSNWAQSGSINHRNCGTPNANCTMFLVRYRWCQRYFCDLWETEVISISVRC